MSRGIVEAQTLRSEQFDLEARTTDLTDAEPGEYWIRVDQTSTNPDIIAELRRQGNSGVTTCPIFDDAEESNLGADVVRGPSVVLDDGSVGFVAMTTGDGAVGSPRAVTAAGTQYLSHNALELSTIPDSLVSRPADTSSGTNRRLGLQFETSQEWSAIQIRISNNTPIDGGVEQYVLEDNNGNNIKTVDVSGKSAGDVVTFESVDLATDTKYIVYLDSSDGSDVNYGRNISVSYPYTSSDGNLAITSGWSNGILASSNAYAVSEIGNVNY